MSSSSIAVLAGLSTLAAMAQEKAPQIRTAKAATEPIERTLRVTGTTQAGKYVSVAGPMMRGPDSGRALVLMNLVKSGAKVKKGDVLAEIDGESLRDRIEERKSEIISAEADIKKRKAEQAIDWENLQQTLRVTKAELDKAKLELGGSETRAEVDRELLKLSVEELEAQYKQQLADIKSKQQSYKSDMRILEITKERHERRLTRYQADIAKFVIRAPMDGMAVMQSIFRSGEFAQVQQGDQVAPGQPFMRVVDPSTMQVEALVSQVESDEIRIGQEATVRFDAFAGLVMKAKVYSVGALATGGIRGASNYMRTLPVRLAIQGSDPRVIPDLSASADILLERKENAVLVPTEALQAHAGKQVVWVLSGGKYEARDVRVGLTSNTRVEILEGVKAGEEVALEPPPAPKS